MKKSSCKNRRKARQHALKLLSDHKVMRIFGKKAGIPKTVFPVIKVQKLEPKPEPGKIYNKTPEKVDHTGMRFIKSKNLWKNESDIAIAAVPGMTAFQVRCSKRINELSPKEKRAAWRNAHNTRPKKKKKVA